MAWPRVMGKPLSEVSVKGVQIGFGMRVGVVVEVCDGFEVRLIFSMSCEVDCLL